MNWPEDRSWADLSVATYAALIESHTNFAQAAYRDGEWYCMLGRSGKNVNGERYDPALGAALRRTLLQPVGQWCAFWWSHDSKGVAIRRQALKWLASHGPDVSWIPDRPIGRAMEEGRAARFWRAVQRRRVVVVGPAHLAGQDLVRMDEHVVVPDAVAWKHEQEIAAKVLDAHRPEDVILFASGMASNLMIHRLWPQVRGRVTLYDIGAALDPYAGRYTRGEYATARWQEHRKDQNRP